jgi:hypothetical protein
MGEDNKIINEGRKEEKDLELCCIKKSKILKGKCLIKEGIILKAITTKKLIKEPKNEEEFNERKI